MPPEINLQNEKNNGQSVLDLIENNLVLSAHDVSNGGLITALSEMAMASDFGLKIQQPKKLTNPIEYFFGEDQGRYILEIDSSNLKEVEKRLINNNTYFERIGFTQKDYFEIEKEFKTKVKDLFEINNQWYNKY